VAKASLKMMRSPGTSSLCLQTFSNLDPTLYIYIYILLFIYIYILLFIYIYTVSPPVKQTVDICSVGMCRPVTETRSIGR